MGIGLMASTHPAILHFAAAPGEFKVPRMLKALNGARCAL